jgi:hypothetical protein
LDDHQRPLDTIDSNSPREVVALELALEAAVLRACRVEVVDESEDPVLTAVVAADLAMESIQLVPDG